MICALLILALCQDPAAVSESGRTAMHDRIAGGEGGEAWVAWTDIELDKDNPMVARIKILFAEFKGGKWSKPEQVNTAKGKFTEPRVAGGKTPVVAYLGTESEEVGHVLDTLYIARRENAAWKSVKCLEGKISQEDRWQHHYDFMEAADGAQHVVFQAARNADVRYSKIGTKEEDIVTLFEVKDNPAGQISAAVVGKTIYAAWVYDHDGEQTLYVCRGDGVKFSEPTAVRANEKFKGSFGPRWVTNGKDVWLIWGERVEPGMFGQDEYYAAPIEGDKPGKAEPFPARKKGAIGSIPVLEARMDSAGKLHSANADGLPDVTLGRTVRDGGSWKTGSTATLKREMGTTSMKGMAISLNADGSLDLLWGETQMGDMSVQLRHLRLK